MKILQLVLVGALAAATAGMAEAKQASSNRGASSVLSGRSVSVSEQPAYPAYNANKPQKFAPFAPARGPFQVY